MGRSCGWARAMSESPEHNGKPPVAKVLLVEDDETTRHLYRAMLEQGGYVVAEAENFKEAANQLDDSIDIALLDIMLRGQSGLEILRHIQLHFPACPVIMVSAHADKSNAIAALNEGAVAYLQKPVDPRELFYTVRHWVDYCKMKEESRQDDRRHPAMGNGLKESLASYRQLVELMPAAVVIHDCQGKILYINPAGQRMLGAESPTALIGSNVLTLVHPDSQSAVRRLKRSIGEGRPCELAELRLLRCDGSSFLGELRAVLSRYEQQQAIQVVVQDISRHQQIEQALKLSEARLQEAQGIARVGNWEWDTQTDEVFFSAEACRIFGMPEGHAGVGFQSVFDLIHPDDQERAKGEIETMLGQHTPLNIEHRIVLPGGEERILNERGLAHLDAEGRVVRVTGTVQEVSQQKEQEALLRRQLRRRELMLEEMSDGFWVVTLDGRLIETNEAYCRLSGYSREELLAMSVPDLEARENPEEIGRHIQAVIEQGYDCFETQHRRKDGSLLDLEISTSMIDEGEQGRHFVAFLRDISERKQAETELRLEKEYSDSLIETAQVIVLVLNPDATIRYFNPYMEDLCGYRLEEVQGRGWFDLFLREEDRPEVQQVFQRAITGVQTRGQINPIITKDGQMRVIEWFDTTLHDSNGEKIGLLTVGHDITESKQAADALLESRDRLQTLVAQAPEGIFVADLNGRYTEVNEAGCRMLGFKRHEIIGKTVFDLIPPEEAERLNQSKDALKQGAVETDQWQLLCKDGAYLPVEVSARILPDGRWQGFVRDISERKKSEQQLQQVMHALGERMKELNCLYQLTALAGSEVGTVQEYLRQAVELLPPGWQYPEITSARIIFQGQEFATQNFRSSNWALSSPIRIQNRDVGRVEICYLEQRPEADQGPFMAEEISLIDAVAGHLGRSLLQMEIERQLRESEIRFRNAFGKAVIGMALVSPQGRFLQVNNALSDIVGYPEQDMLTKTFQEITHPDDLDADLESLASLSAGKISKYQLEKRYFHKLGHIVWVRISVSAVRYAGGDIQYYVVQVEDIGERKTLEDQLRQSQQRLQLIQENAPDYIFQVGPDGVITYVNRTPPGIVMADMLGTSLQRWLKAEEPGAFESILQQAFGRQEVAEYEARSVVAGGVFSLRIKPVVSGDEVNSAVLVAHDISESKRMSLELAKSQKRFSDLFQSANEGIALHELVFGEPGRPVDYILIDVNAAYEEILGIRRWQAIGRLASELYGSNDAPYREIFAQVAMSGEPTSFETYFSPMDKYFRISVYSPGENMFATMFADISERKQAEMLMHEHQEKLERFNKMAVGRELAMIDLKREINALLVELGRPRKYTIHEPQVTK